MNQPGTAVGLDEVLGMIRMHELAGTGAVNRVIADSEYCCLQAIGRTLGYLGYPAAKSVALGAAGSVINRKFALHAQETKVRRARKKVAKKKTAKRRSKK